MEIVFQLTSQQFVFKNRQNVVTGYYDRVVRKPVEKTRNHNRGDDGVSNGQI